MILSAKYAAEALARGLSVVRPSGEVVPIPPILEPLVLDLKRESADAALLVQAASKAALRLCPETHDFGALTELELACLKRRRERGGTLRLVTARIDYIFGKVLEINATIPAMQGYSDIVVEAFLAAHGVDGERADELLSQNGRNTDDLFGALVAYAELTGRKRPGAQLTIGIVARKGDAQIGELRHYQKRWGELGGRVILSTPESLELGRAGHKGVLRAEGQDLDLVYRHLFSWRVEPQTAFAKAFIDAEDYGIVNPVALDIESKATLAELSLGADRGDSFLAPNEVDAIRRLVPYTRILDQSTVEQALLNRERMVLKRAWDYGGKSVYLGIDTNEADWQALVKQHLRGNEDDRWVLQELASGPTVQRTQAGGAPFAAYEDLCTFATLGLPVQAHGGASRVAPRRVVNILSGGGLAPVITPELAKALGLGEAPHV